MPVPFHTSAAKPARVLPSHHSTRHLPDTVPLTEMPCCSPVLPVFHQPVLPLLALLLTPGTVPQSYE